MFGVEYQAHARCGHCFSTPPDFSLTPLHFSHPFILRPLIILLLNFLPIPSFIRIESNQALLLEQALTDSGLRAAVSDENVELMNDFNVRLRVLQQLGYIDADRTVQLKGRVAAEVSTCDALIVTELVFENVLTELPPDEAVALLSALVFQQKNVVPQLDLVPESLRRAVARVQTLATGLAHMQVTDTVDE